jgi:hypothetical protein
VRIDSADLTDFRPTEYRADVVVQLRREDSVLGIVVEVQLNRDEDKGFVWPVYIATLRNRIRCPVCLLVVAPDAKVAKWARQPILLGGESRVVPWVLHAANIPQIVNLEQAKSHPELAVLSALAHGRDPDIDKALEIALVAQDAAARLDTGHAELYFDLIACCLSEAASKRLLAMDPKNYEYQSEFARRYVGEGVGRGEVKALVGVALMMVSKKFGDATETTRDRIQHASVAELKPFIERLVDAQTLDEALGALG